MKQVVRLLLVLCSTAIPLIYSGQALAAPRSVVQELHVQATVPDHRDIIVNNQGDITKISSNTLKDVTPSVYLGSIAPANKIEVTDELYAEYRKHVPVGTAKYGVLYEQNVVVALLSVRTPRS